MDWRHEVLNHLMCLLKASSISVLCTVHFVQFTILVDAWGIGAYRTSYYENALYVSAMHIFWFKLNWCTCGCVEWSFARLINRFPLIFLSLDFHRNTCGNMSNVNRALAKMRSCKKSPLGGQPCQWKKTTAYKELMKVSKAIKMARANVHADLTDTSDSSKEWASSAYSCSNSISVSHW